MKLDTPTIAIIVAIAFFYIKVVFFQWRKARAEAKKTNIEIAKARKKGKTPEIPAKPSGFFNIQVISWYAVGATLVLVLVGYAMQSMTFLPAEVTAFWWVLIVIGIVGLTFSVK